MDQKKCFFSPFSIGDKWNLSTHQMSTIRDYPITDVDFGPSLVIKKSRIIKHAVDTPALPKESVFNLEISYS